jgi:hypothetical protein
MRKAYKVLVGKPEEMGIDERIILKWFINISRVWTGFIWLKTESSGGIVKTIT